MRTIFTLTLVLFIVSCNSKPELKEDTHIILNTSNKANGLKEYEVKDNEKDKETYWIYKKGDVTVFKKPCLTGFTIKTEYKNNQKEIQLKKGDSTIIAPEVCWVNDDFVYIHTYWKNVNTNDFLIPYKTKDPIRCLAGPIIASDGESNTVIMTINETISSITLKAYNFITGETKSIVLEKGKSFVLPMQEDFIFTSKEIALNLNNSKIYFK